MQEHYSSTICGLFVFQFGLFPFQFGLFLFQCCLFLFQFGLFVFQFGLFVFQFGLFVFQFGLFVFKFGLFVFLSVCISLFIRRKFMGSMFLVILILSVPFIAVNYVIKRSLTEGAHSRAKGGIYLIKS